MFSLADNFAILVISLMGLVIIIWGYTRAKPYGEIGILAWLQSIALMLPWLIFFFLLSFGIYLNLIAVIFFLVFSAAVYIYLGNRIRTKAKETIKTGLRVNPQSLEKTKEGQQTPEEKTPEETSSLAVTSETQITPIPEEELKEIKGIFSIDTFFATETIPYQDGVIFKGNLRGEAEFSHRTLSQKLREKLGDKYRLFLVETPEEKPVVVILPATNDPRPLSLAQKNLAFALFIVTIFTTMEAVAFLLGFDLVGNWQRWREVLPLTLGLWLILLAHEIAHHVVGRNRGVKVSLPFFLPSLQIGSFGAITRFESVIPNRSVLFDTAFAGPATGFLVSLLILIIGMSLSTGNEGLEIPTLFFRGSILVGSIAKFFFQSSLEADSIHVHPFTILGWLGLVINAINVLPAGQLDGGRMVQAIYGRKTCRRTTVGTLVVLGIVSLFNPINSLPFYWAIIILFLQRDLERPCLNELSEPDDTRAAWGLFMIFLSLATLIPITPSLATRLGIGIL
ncbi:MAG: site-2 protease family protein [Geminocystis sp.]|nr:site-2 protease family protein [Geminocystis sp.]HIK36649.1 site-2 protease family protein [Geminocystis sp. M7585_C2015_104]MCS7147896.1 site-2 protease family protein [Geminocystis sp.]MCX8078722.1 site-2 protease family protein [Geminocystis sp.]MDW8117016.1 site-2 protease family protein [Geminocystis sp.]